MRESTTRGPAIDLGEFERRLRGPEQKASQGKVDPLSELARLMQGEEASPAADAYSRILSAEPRTARPQAPTWSSQSAASSSRDEAITARLRGSLEAHTPSVEPSPRAFQDRSSREPGYADDDDASRQATYKAPYQEPAYQAEPAYQGAEGNWPDESQYLDYGQAGEESGYDDEAAAGAGGRRWPRLRPWHAVAGLGLIGLVSIGWGFAHRNGADGPRDVATINAPDGPVKVQPSAEADQGGSGTGATVLDRKESAPVKKVVTNQEQAVDPILAPPAAVELGSGPVDAPHEPAPLAVTQPRKVKSVTVRPDGSRVADDALPPAVAKATGAGDNGAGAASVRGGTPKSAAKPGTTPRASKTKPAPKVATAEAPEADDGAAEQAAPAAAHAVAKGGYAVQFGAANSEAEARALMKTIAGKYGSQLGGHRPTFKIAKVGDKTVYRVRAAGMSKESATGICEKVKAGGGACFVAGN